MCRSIALVAGGASRGSGGAEALAGDEEELGGDGAGVAGPHPSPALREALHRPPRRGYPGQALQEYGGH